MPLRLHTSLHCGPLPLLAPLLQIDTALSTYGNGHWKCTHRVVLMLQA